MKVFCALCLLLISGPTQAQSVWYQGFTLSSEELMRCAAILDLVETEPDNAPEFAGQAVDFSALAFSLKRDVAAFHGIALQSALYDQAYAFWALADDTIENRNRMAQTLDTCMQVLSARMHLGRDVLCRNDPSCAF